MTTRRTFLAASLALLGSRSAFAVDNSELYVPPAGTSSRNDLFLPGTASPGISASYTLLAQVDALAAIEEGRTGPKIRIIFEFGCPRSPELYRRIRPMLAAARFEWMPIPSLKPDNGAPTAALFASGAGPARLADVFAGRKTVPGDEEAAVRQARRFVDIVGPSLAVETSRPFVTPTLVYSGRDGEAKIIRGAPDLGTLRTIVASAK